MIACSVASKAQHLFGRVAAQELITYIADIEASENAAEMIDHLHGSISVMDEAGCLEISASAGALCLSPCEKFSKSESGKVDWHSVTSLRLDDVEGFQ